MKPPPPRTAFWIGLLIAGLSGQMNVLVLLWAWSAIASLSSQPFADTHYLLVRAAGLTVHLAIYLAILVAVRKLVAPKSPTAESLTTLVTSLSYSAVVIGLTAYLATLGGLP
jgi:hypothetical protein